MERLAVKILIFDSEFHCSTSDWTLTLADAVTILVNCLDNEKFAYGAVLSQDMKIEYARVCGKAFAKMIENGT